MLKKQSGGISLLLMIAITFITQVLILMKSSVVAGIFGTSGDMDAFNLANSIVSFLFGFLSAGVSTIIIPEYANHRNRKAVDSFISWTYISLFAVIGLMITLRTHLVDALSNRDELFIYTVSGCMMVLLLAQTLSSVANITTAYFQCEGYYNIPKIITLISQLSVVIALLLIGDMTIMQYTYVIAAGIAINFAVDTVLALKKGWKYSPTLRITSETKTLIRRFFPIIFSTGIYNLTLMIDSTITALLETGKVTLLSYSSQISAMINTVVVGNLLMYIYPKITKNIKSHHSQRVFWEQTQLFHAIVCLMIVGFITVGQEAVTLLFCRGQFTYESGVAIFYGALIYLFGQQTNVLRNMVYRYFYAIGDTKAPASNSVLVSVANIIISLILVCFIGFYGVIFGTVLSSFLSLVMMMIRFGKKIGFTESVWWIVRKYFKNLLLAAITAAVVLLTKYLLPIPHLVVSVLVYGVETVALYVGSHYVFNRHLFKTMKEL